MHRAVFALVTLIAALAGADGIPTPDSLVYSGVALGPGGNPLPGTPAILVALWDSESGGTKRCDSAGQTVRYGGDGRFSVNLPSCTAAVSQNANLFVEVSVTGVPLPRMKIAASPYAVEAHRSSTTSQILTGMTTVTVNASGGAQFSSFDAAWQWTQGKVIRGKLTIQLANGSYDLSSTLGYELEHPDGQNISIIGNTNAPQSVILNAPNGIRIGQSRLGLLNGVRVQGTGAAQSIGINVFHGASVVAGPALQVQGYNFPVQIESGATGVFLGGSFTCTQSGGGVGARDGAYVQIDNGVTNSCSIGFTALTARLRCQGCIANGGSIGFFAQDGASLIATSASAPGAATTFNAVNHSFIRAPNPVGTATYSPALTSLGNANSVIVP